MVCRSEARGKDAVEQVKKDSGNTDVHLKVCDVSSLTSIAAFADDFKQTGAGLHVLINNAGAMFEERQRSSEGFDMSFATNTLGQLALTVQLLPALAASAPSRVLMVSSGGMYTVRTVAQQYGLSPMSSGALVDLISSPNGSSAPPGHDTHNAPHVNLCLTGSCETLDVSDFENKQLNPWDGTRAYAKDKRRQVALAEHLAQLWHPQGVDVYSMHPGWADTEGVRTSMPGFHKAFKNTLRDAKEGSDTIVWLALQDQDKLQPGAFYLDRAPQPKHLSLAGTQHTPQQAAELYDKLLRLAGTATAS
eukprot:jgi/Chrzof1/12139/Cz06g22190.t1